MTMILTIESLDLLDNGEPASITLDRHGATIGRSPHADWSLPDSRNRISSRHCEIAYRDGAYVLTDLSTNGTYLNGASERLQAPHPIAHGDRFAIGHYAIVAHHHGTAVTPASASPAVTHEDRWESFAPPAPPPVSADAGEGWAEPPEPLLPTAGNGWRAEAGSAPSHAAGAWDLPAPVTSPSAWSSAPSRAVAPLANDVWGRLAEKSDIDWQRGNFMAIAPSTEDRVLPGAARADGIAPNEAEWRQSDVPPKRTAQDAPAHAAAALEREAESEDAWACFVAESGLPADRLKRSPAEALAAAGTMVRQLVGGLMLMMEARARAKAQLGVQATGLELDGNNVFKFVRAPERALLQLLDAPEPGFMTAERAVEDAYQDLQAHQMATLNAMRGALQGTLARFSPAAIRERVGEPDRSGRWLPMLHKARKWEEYERGFEGVVRGADDAFMDLFAKEFRLHYERHIGEMKAQRRADPPV
ncbi:type VI secretion system-associated FHA domain protein TagH [Sphingomonas sp. DT-51]|uniref:type VI secretion system-associated FHA domain protein TagH n=1 Tax=Sphingomonas sp. DT-51 TaxID=3396165 RepID=UPI003F1BC7C6